MGQYAIKSVSTEEIEQYIPLVYKVVNQWNTSSSVILDRDDLVSIGMLGLMDAYQRFDPSKNVDFEGYAKLRVRGAIIDEIRKVGAITRRQTTALKSYLATTEKLQQELLRMPTDDEVCSALGWSFQELNKNYETLNMMSTVSLDGLVVDHQDEEVQDRTLLVRDTSDSALDKLEKETERALLTEAISRLRIKEQQVLQLHYVEGLNFHEISEVLDVSPSRISQIYRQAIASLRLYIKR